MSIGNWFNTNKKAVIRNTLIGAGVVVTAALLISKFKPFKRANDEGTIESEDNEETTDGSTEE